MKTLNIFKQNIQFQYWGEIYLGCKNQWISPNNVLSFCENEKIKNSNEEHYISLYLALDDSLFAFYERLKTFISEDSTPLINHNEDSCSEFLFEYIPPIYWKIWELEFLLEIKELPLSNVQKLEEIASLFDRINYPEEWKPFLYYQLQKDGRYLKYDELYQNFLHYIDMEISRRKLSKG